MHLFCTSEDINNLSYNLMIKDYLESEFKEIITLDYLSHEKLQNKKINHTVSDIFISESEFKNLDELSYNFVKWHDNSEIKNLITYKVKIIYFQICS